MTKETLGTVMAVMRGVLDTKLCESLPVTYIKETLDMLDFVLVLKTKVTDQFRSNMAIIMVMGHNSCSQIVEMWI